MQNIEFEEYEKAFEAIAGRQTMGKTLLEFAHDEER